MIQVEESAIFSDIDRVQSMSAFNNELCSRPDYVSDFPMIVDYCHGPTSMQSCIGKMQIFGQSGREISSLNRTEPSHRTIFHDHVVWKDVVPAKLSKGEHDARSALPYRVSIQNPKSKGLVCSLRNTVEGETAVRSSDRALMSRARKRGLFTIEAMLLI